MSEAKRDVNRWPYPSADAAAQPLARRLQNAAWSGVTSGGHSLGIGLRDDLVEAAIALAALKTGAPQ